MVDANGVLIAAVQALHHNVEEIRSQNAVLRRQNADIRRELAHLRRSSSRSESE